MAELNFDATSVTPDAGVAEPVPTNWYKLAVDESDVKPCGADGLGVRLAVRITILEGPYKGRKLFHGFNIRNANPVAQEIAYKQLSALAHAVGVMNVKDSSMLHNIPFNGRVRVVPPKNGYDATNEITAFKHISEVVDYGPANAAPAVSAAITPPPVGMPAPVAPPVGMPSQPWAQPAPVGMPAPAAAPVAPPVGMPAPMGAPVAPAAPVAPVAPVAAPFPPEGWALHPSAPGYYYCGQEVLSEADLRARVATPAPAVSAPPPPPVATVQQEAPAVADPAAQAQGDLPPWMKPQT